MTQEAGRPSSERSRSAFCVTLTFVPFVVVAVSVDDMRRIPNRAAAAAGLHKVDAILGLLRGRLANILITDQTTAEELLRRTH